MAVTLDPTDVGQVNWSEIGNQRRSAYTSVPGFLSSSKWVNFTSSRSMGVTYTNSTSDPIVVCINRATSYDFFLYINGVLTMNPKSTPIGTYPVQAFIPNGSTYRVGDEGDATTFTSWFELRN
jgi:hypothetical protein